MTHLVLTHAELIILLLLVLVAAFAVLARRVHVPYPIVMVIGGLALGFVPHVPRPVLQPEVVLFIFLPPLLFSASFHLSWREFRREMVNIVMLAFGLVGISLFGIAAITDHLIPGLDWKLGLVLAAVVAATDAIAATATAKRLGLPRRIVDLLEAESLVNDGSGLLALRFTSAIVVTGVTPSFLAGTGQLTYLVAAAIVIGMAIGWVADRVQSAIADAPVEITISIITPYVTYFAAESAHCSGVLATIACGLFLGRRSSGFYSLHARIESSAVWRTLDFILNGVVFLLLGLQLPAILNDIRDISRTDLVLYGTLFSTVVIVFRIVSVWGGAWVSNRINRYILRRHEPPLNRKLVFLVGWAGMRGVLALAAAMSLPNNFPKRSLIIFLTYSAIFATLVLQGLTMPAIIRRLGLASVGSVAEEEERSARRAMINGALNAIEELRSAGPYSSDTLSVMADYYRRQLEMLDGQESDPDDRGSVTVHDLGRHLRDVERRVVVRLRNEEQIHDEVLRTLERELDLLDARFAD